MRGDLIVGCVFCGLEHSGRVEMSFEHFIVIRDVYPVSLGHTLIIPKRHVATYFDLRFEERENLLSVIDAVKLELDVDFRPDGYNIGFNVGEVAGQTVMHCHVHVIPRYVGDMEDPRGGVRGVIPEKQKY